MKNDTGLVLPMPENRIQMLSDLVSKPLESDSVEHFDEPVPRFNTKAGNRFVCLVVHHGQILMLAEGTKSYPGGTSLRSYKS